MMLWVLVLLLPRVGLCAMTQIPLHQEDRKNGGDDLITRPHIYFCRSPNMEEFTCWWHPLDNISQINDNVTYTFTYYTEKTPRSECHDYVTGGLNSCHFDSSHTSIWTLYCMEVTASTLQGNFTSQEHCLDVVEIVETEAPVNLTYTFLDANEEEMGRTVNVSWVYPIPAHIQFGWITLVFELQYRRIAEPTNWKVKGLLRERHLEILDLPIGEYIVQVRCRPHNKGHWSKWSSSLLVKVPGRPTSDKLLALLLVTGICVMALLVIGFGIIPHGKRLKAYLLPPIPKPRISGIDPLLLKKGSMDEINRHFMSLQGYKPPSYSEEVWDKVNMDCRQALHENQGILEGEGRVNLVVPSILPPTAAQKQLPNTPNPYLLSPFPYCQAISTVRALQSTNSAQVGLLSVPGSDYSLMANPIPATPFISVPSTSQDFYTCVNGMSDNGEVQLVPCLSNSVKHSPYVQLKEELEERAEKSYQLADYLVRKIEMVAYGKAGVKEAAPTEQSEVVMPLLPDVTIDRV